MPKFESNRFEANCSYFERQNPRASALLSIVDASHLHVVKTGLDELNLKDTRRKSEHSLYHQEEGALKEQEESLSKLDLKNAKIVTIFGLGLGFAYYALEFW